MSHNPALLILCSKYPCLVLCMYKHLKSFFFKKKVCNTFYTQRTMGLKQSSTANVCSTIFDAHPLDEQPCEQSCSMSIFCIEKTITHLTSVLTPWDGPA